MCNTYEVMYGPILVRVCLFESDLPYSPNEEFGGFDPLYIS